MQPANLRAEKLAAFFNNLAQSESK